MRRLIWLVVLAGLGSALMASAAEPFDHSHGPFTSVLRDCVTNGLVKYQTLKATPRPLDEYLSQLAHVSRPEFDQWTEPQRIAFLINLYNATTLRLVREHYPVADIRKIGSLLKSPWKLEVVEFFGTKQTLDEIEHQMLRKNFREPRIHFALVCAARSCPALRAEAYEAAHLEGQLQDQGIRFLARTDQNRVDAARDTIWLSEIFKWYEGDFLLKAKTLQEFVTPLLPAESAQAARRTKFKVKFTGYDWSLNDVAREPRRACPSGPQGNGGSG